MSNNLFENEMAIDQYTNISKDKQKNYSPTRKEMIHMRPSNQFSEITEDQFNKKEAEKNLYKLELKQ